MADIHVVFPETGKPMVFSDPEAVVPGENVQWHVISYNARVRKVRISFKQQGKVGHRRISTGSFFPVDTTKVSVAATSIEKTIAAPRQTTLIWGQAPALKGRRLYKYTVHGLDARDRAVSSLDPTIISDTP